MEGEIAKVRNKDKYMQSNDCLQEGSNIGKCLDPNCTSDIVEQVRRCRRSISPVPDKSNSIHWQNPRCELEVQSF